MSGRTHTKSMTGKRLKPNPSGRFDALVDMGNPMKGTILFPYLQRPWSCLGPHEKKVQPTNGGLIRLCL